jgi:hypothetical protein
MDGLSVLANLYSRDRKRLVRFIAAVRPSSIARYIWAVYTQNGSTCIQMTQDERVSVCERINPHAGGKHKFGASSKYIDFGLTAADRSTRTHQWEVHRSRT